jgi:phospholipid N-methyltransferase
MQNKEASSIRFRPLIEFAMSLDEENRNAGLTAIAQHFISTLSLHYLDIMSIFQQKAEQEEIDLEEREGTFHDILEASFPLMLGLSSNISIQSLNDLLTLSNITVGLYRLSHVDSAERAQRWMYKLPKLYHSQLAQAHLLISSIDTTF